MVRAIASASASETGGGADDGIPVLELLGKESPGGGGMAAPKESEGGAKAGGGGKLGGGGRPGWGKPG